MLDKYQLPNGNWIYHLNNYETDFVYNEIFVNETYLKHGIKIETNATVLDIGANIGLFSLYIKQKYPNSKIYAFEPIPEVFQILTANLVEHEEHIKTYNYALSNKNEMATFHYYPGFSVISGFHANQTRDAEIIMSGMQSKYNENNMDMPALVTKRLTQLTSFQCQTISLAYFIQQEKISHIDLLKLDIEGAELAVIEGITQNDWLKIRQIVMEVHNEIDLNKIISLLEQNNFELVVEADKQLKNAGIYNIFAVQG